MAEHNRRRVLGGVSVTGAIGIECTLASASGLIAQRILRQALIHSTTQKARSEERYGQTAEAAAVRP